MLNRGRKGIGLTAELTRATSVKVGNILTKEERVETTAAFASYQTNLFYVSKTLGLEGGKEGKSILHPFRYHQPRAVRKAGLFILSKL